MTPDTRCAHGAAPAIVLIGALALVAATALAAPTVGFRESFPGTSTQAWGGGGFDQLISNPGTGGYLGAGDGYLNIVTNAPANWGARNATATYVGDWVAAGVTEVRVWLNDVGAQDAIEIHFSIGNGLNFWQYDPGFVPPHGNWGPFVVDLTNSAAFTRIIGAGTFQQALQATDRIHFRHDKAPFVQTPDPIQADAGIDEILLTNGTVGVDAGRPGAVAPLRLAPPYPNPSRGPVTLEFESAAAGPLRLQVVDVAGRIVRETRIESAQAGSQRWLWDGRDDRGLRLAPGRYRVRLFGAAGGMSQPVVIVH